MVDIVRVQTATGSRAGEAGGKGETKCGERRAENGFEWVALGRQDPATSLRKCDRKEASRSQGAAGLSPRAPAEPRPLRPRRPRRLRPAGPTLHDRSTSDTT